MTDLRLADALSVDRESCDEHIRHVEMMLDTFPLEAPRGEQAIELLNIRRRASLARAALQKGLYFPKLPRLVEPASLCGELDGED